MTAHERWQIEQLRTLKSSGRAFNPTVKEWHGPPNAIHIRARILAALAAIPVGRALTDVQREQLDLLWRRHRHELTPKVPADSV